MNNIETLKLALEAFEWNYNTDLDNIPACEQWAKMLKKNITALRQAIEQAQQAEPVAWATREDFYFELNRRVDQMRKEMVIKTVTMRCKEYDLALPIVNMYGGHIVVGQVITPPPRQPLTDEEINSIAQNNHPLDGIRTFARAIEAAHGIKGEA